jgi:hypothetical protein
MGHQRPTFWPLTGHLAPCLIIAFADSPPRILKSGQSPRASTIGIWNLEADGVSRGKSRDLPQVLSSVLHSCRTADAGEYSKMTMIFKVPSHEPTGKHTRKTAVGEQFRRRIVSMGPRANRRRGRGTCLKSTDVRAQTCEDNTPDSSLVATPENSYCV